MAKSEFELNMQGEMKEELMVGSAVFVTFSGNCKNALTFYQSCFGGQLNFQFLDVKIPGVNETPILIGSLKSKWIRIYGSDLVPNEGRLIGNSLAIFVNFQDKDQRNNLMERLNDDSKRPITESERDNPLIEITDRFDVSWILAV